MEDIRWFSIEGVLMKVFPLLALIIYSFGELFVGSKYILLGFALVQPFAFYLISGRWVNKTLFYFIFMVFVGSIMNLFVTKNGIGGTILFLTNVLLAIYCLKCMEAVKCVALLVLCYNFVFLYNKLFVEMVNPNYIYEDLGLSRNHPGVLLVIWTCFLGFTRYVTEQKMIRFFPIIACVIAFFLEGRSSLGILLFLSVVSLFIGGRMNKFLAPLLLCVLILSCWSVIPDLYMMTSFARNSLESSRDIIWSAYFDALNPLSFFGGVDVSQIPAITSVGNNPHNAFLNFHCRMGILGVLALWMLMIKSVIEYIKLSDFVPLLFFFCIFVRMMFDSCINTTYDFILYAILLYPILKNQTIEPE